MKSYARKVVLIFHSCTKSLFYCVNFSHVQVCLKTVFVQRSVSTSINEVVLAQRKFLNWIHPYIGHLVILDTCYYWIVTNNGYLPISDT